MESHETPDTNLNLHAAEQRHAGARGAIAVGVAAGARIDLDTLKQQVDLREIVALDLGQGKRQGKTVRWWNPPWSANAHKSGSRAFTVWSGSFYDFSTNDRGDVITYFERRDNLCRADAIQRFREYVGNPSTATRKPRQTVHHDFTPAATNEPPPSHWQRDAADAYGQAERYLWSEREDAHRALNYLRYARGLSDDTIRHFHLGYNPTWNKLTYRAPESGKPINLAPGITIPYQGDAAIWAVRVRQRVDNLAEALGIEADHTRDGEPYSKYTNLAGAGGRKPLYNGAALKPGVDVLFVEGEFDAQLAQQELGDAAAVVTFGATSNIPDQITARWRDQLQAAGQVYLALDNDQAGTDAAKRLIAALVEIDKEPILYPIPAGKDATEYVIDHVGDLSKWWADRPLDIVIKAPQIAETAASPSTPPTDYEYAQTDPYMYPEGIYPVFMQKAINHFCLKETGGATVGYLIQRGLQLGTITAPTVAFTQLQETQRKLDWNISETTLRRYFGGEVPFLHPRKGQKLECNSGTERTLCTIVETKEALKRRYKIDLHVKYFRDRERTNVDPITGETYTLPMVPADLPAQAFIDAGYDEITAHRVAEGLKDDPLTFDQPTRKRRSVARERAVEAYNVFCQSLDDPTVVAPAAEVHIASEPDFKRAIARAWHREAVDGFQTQSEQMWALGIASKHTLNKYLQGAGVEKVEHIEKVMIDPTKDVGKQIRENIRNLNAFPVTFVTGMGEGGEYDPDNKPRRDLYDRQKIDEAIERGETIYIEYQQANSHEIVELPPAPAAQQEPPQPRRENDEERKPARRIKREIPTPGTYPATWTRNHLRHRYKLRLGQEAPDDMTIQEIVDALMLDILLRPAKDGGAIITRLA